MAEEEFNVRVKMVHSSLQATRRDSLNKMLKLDASIVEEFEQYAVDTLFSDGQHDVIERADCKKIDGERNAPRLLTPRTCSAYDAVDACRWLNGATAAPKLKQFTMQLKLPEPIK